MFEIPPLAILAIGIVTVLGMIIVLKLNAFLALITAAMVVSLLAPGEIEDKIARVASAFGASAGGIAVVIALAAVIGKCMMDSGAADRVVRAFLRVLGEKRSPIALMGSGFVLAVPVFFDTVFYLLVPLARSLHRRTGQQYLKYLLAIAAGGAITHTLVPPTPGPLLMASNLNIDVGVMIMVGALVALPAACAGLLFAGLADKVMPLPMRKLGAEPEPEPLSDDELPSLWLSLAPVVLPVLLISTNTILKTMADQEHAALLRAGDVNDWPALVRTLDEAETSSAAASQPARRIVQALPESTQAAVKQAAADGQADEKLKTQLLADINSRVLRSNKFYDPADAYFDHVILTNPRIGKLLEHPPEVTGGWDEAARLRGLRDLNTLLKADRSKMDKVTVERLNRLLLESAYPQIFKRHVWVTPTRRAADVSALFGNANLALLLSAAVAMWTLYLQRKPSREEMAQTVEVSLMSGGVIILITAAGGAFGAMLKAAEIGPAIEKMFGAGATGMALLLLGFGVAALLKVAQGSSTVAMITGSAMLAAMIPSPESLPFNMVYVATAIGAGSLIGSWMNDSGFWIFAKMGGLTEVEALKSWTILLVVLGIISLGVTMLLATYLPLTALT